MFQIAKENKYNILKYTPKKVSRGRKRKNLKIITCKLRQIVCKNKGKNVVITQPYLFWNQKQFVKIN